MIIKDLAGKTMELDIDEKTTIGDIKELIQAKLGVRNPGIILIGNGRTLSNDEVVNQSYNIIVVKQKLDATPDAPQVQPAEPNEVPEATPQERPEQPVNPVNPVNSSQGYTRTYNNRELYHAVAEEPLILVNIISLMSLSNPFVPSHLVVTPELLKNQLNDMFNDPEFRLTIRCSSAEHDPIAHILDRIDSLSSISDPSESDYETSDDSVSSDSDFVDSPYELDRLAVLRIMDVVDATPDTFEQIKDIYLFLDRDEDETVLNLRQM